MTLRTKSAEQTAVLHWIEQGTGSAVIEAVAGSGKTSTLIDCIERITRTTRDVQPRILFVTFNRANCDHAVQRLKNAAVRVDVRTFNSIGFEICKQHNNTVCVDNLKRKRAFREQVELRVNMAAAKHRAAERQLWLQSWPFIDHCLQRARSIGVLPFDRDAHDPDTRFVDPVFICDATVDHTHLLPKNVAADATVVTSAVCSSISQLVSDVLSALIADRCNIDFADQVYQPVVYRSRIHHPYDWIFVDEAQDVSSVQHALLRLLCNPSGITRLCAAGDSSQSLYAFRGADADSMNRLQTLFDAVRLPLHTSFRCPERVVALAKCIVPSIRAATDAVHGETHRCHWTASRLLGNLQAGDLVVAPRNADLMNIILLDTASGKLMRWIAPTFFTNWVQTLERIFRDIKPPTVAAFHVPVTSFPGTDDVAGIKSTSALGRIIHSMSVRNFVSVIESATAATVEDSNTDETAAMAYLLLRTVADVDETSAWDGIKNLYAALVNSTKGGLCNPDAAVTLATIHVAKGMEARRVFVINVDRLSAVRSRATLAIRTHQNAVYVAITRAAHCLTFVSICADESLIGGTCECKTKHCPIPFIDRAMWPRMCT